MAQKKNDKDIAQDEEDKSSTNDTPKKDFSDKQTEASQNNSAKSEEVVELLYLAIDNIPLMSDYDGQIW